MGIDDDIAILAAAPLLGFFGHDALRLVTFASERRSLEPDAVLFRRGDPADGGFVVLSGSILLAPRVAGGAPVTAGPSALIGRMALFVPGERPTDARAGEAAEVLRIAPVLVRRLMEEFPAAAVAIHAALAEDLAALSGGLARVRSRLDAAGGLPSPG